VSKRVVILVHIVVEITMAGVRGPWVKLLASNPTIGVEPAVVVHALCAKVVAVRNEAADIALRAQDLGHDNIQVNQGLPSAEG
jgi:hypothetical protein